MTFFFFFFKDSRVTQSLEELGVKGFVAQRPNGVIALPTVTCTDLLRGRGSNRMADW